MLALKRYAYKTVGGSLQNTQSLWSYSLTEKFEIQLTHNILEQINVFPGYLVQCYIIAMGRNQRMIGALLIMGIGA